MIEQKIKALKALFKDCPNREATYAKIIELGRSLPPLDEQYKIPANLVIGCQSTVYLKTYLMDGKVFFEADANALISAGLVYLLISVYSGEAPETILTYPPKFLDEMGIYASLSLNRSNGLAQMLLKMRQESIQFLSHKNH